MEIKVFINMDAYIKRKPMLCKRVSDVENFDFHAVRKVLKCLYGDDVYIEILCS